MGAGDDMDDSRTNNDVSALTYCRVLRWHASIAAVAMMTTAYPSAAAEHHWQCSAPSGTYVDRDFDVPPDTTRVTGKMVIRAARGIARWQPYAKAVFIDRKDSSENCDCSGISASLYQNDPAFISTRLESDGVRSELGRVPSDQPVPFDLTFAPNGILTLKVGSRQVIAMSSHVRRNAVQLSCSSADVDFTFSDFPAEKPAPERCPLAAQEQWSKDDVDRYCAVRR